MSGGYECPTFIYPPGRSGVRWEMILHGQDWWSVHIPVWEEYLGHLFEQELHALEVGSYEGRSTCWIMERIRHPRSTLTCIDTWDGRDATIGSSTIAAESAFDHNTKEYREAHRLHKLKGDSIRRLAELLVPIKLWTSYFGLIYIDGCHEGLNTLTDLVMCWQLLVPGGYLVFDVYLWNPSPNMLINVQPSVAWDAFAAMKPSYTMIHQHRQCIVRKAL